MTVANHFSMETAVFEWACNSDPDNLDTSPIMLVHYVPRHFGEAECSAAEWLDVSSKLVEMIVRFEAGAMRQSLQDMLGHRRAEEPFELEQLGDVVRCETHGFIINILETWLRVTGRLSEVAPETKFTALEVIELMLWEPAD